MTNIICKCGVGAAAAIVLAAGTAHADEHVLTVDLSVANQVTISGGPGVSLATVSGSDAIGVYLENFYGGSGDALSAALASGDLTNAENPADGSPALFRGGGGSDPGLNIWSFSSDSTVTSTAGSRAFVGSATWALDANEYADMLAGSMSGNVYFPADTVDDIAGATAIGAYLVVPTPGAIALLGLAGLARSRRR
jgi:hypothetical protein